MLEFDCIRVFRDYKRNYENIIDNIKFDNYSAFIKSKLIKHDIIHIGEWSNSKWKNFCSEMKSIRFPIFDCSIKTLFNNIDDGTVKCFKNVVFVNELQFYGENLYYAERLDDKIHNGRIVDAVIKSQGSVSPSSTLPRTYIDIRKDNNFIRYATEVVSWERISNRWTLRDFHHCDLHEICCEVHLSNPHYIDINLQ